MASAKPTFMTLPVEIRLGILQYLLPDVKEIRCRNDAYNSAHPEGIHRYVPPLGYRRDGGSCWPQIARVNRQLSAECDDLTYNRRFVVKIYGRHICFARAHMSDESQPELRIQFPARKAKVIIIELVAEDWSDLAQDLNATCDGFLNSLSVADWLRDDHRSLREFGIRLVNNPDLHDCQKWLTFVPNKALPRVVNFLHSVDGRVVYVEQLLKIFRVAVRQAESAWIDLGRLNSNGEFDWLTASCVEAMNRGEPPKKRRMQRIKAYVSCVRTFYWGYRLSLAKALKALVKCWELCDRG